MKIIQNPHHNQKKEENLTKVKNVKIKVIVVTK